MAADLRVRSFEGRLPIPALWFGHLDLDFGISDPGVVGKETEISYCQSGRRHRWSHHRQSLADGVTGFPSRQEGQRPAPLSIRGCGAARSNGRATADGDAVSKRRSLAIKLRTPKSFDPAGSSWRRFDNGRLNASGKQDGRMTRPAQKESERRTLDAVMNALGLGPDQEPEEGEAPDFIMRIAGRVTGLEVTAYRSGDTVEDGTPRRAAEAEWEKLKRSAEIFRSQRAELGDINVGLMFKDSVPARGERNAFLEEIAGFVRGHTAEIAEQDREYWPQAFLSPLMQTYLRTLYLRRDRYPEWYTNLTAGYIARPGPTIAEIVAEKSQKQFRPVDELWLAIQCGVRISEMMLDLTGVADFDAVPNLSPFVFSRVFVLAYTGIYEWSRGGSWQKLAGESIQSVAASFDELKNILNDPEWLADPDKKATQVALECLREIRKAGDKS